MWTLRLHPPRIQREPTAPEGMKAATAVGAHDKQRLRPSRRGACSWPRAKRERRPSTNALAGCRGFRRGFGRRRLRFMLGIRRPGAGSVALPRGAIGRLGRARIGRLRMC